MKILQVTNIVSHHQLPLARELCALVGVDNFRFAALQGSDPSREKNGWESNYDERWILKPGENDVDALEFEKFWDEADVVLCGERLIKKMKDRTANGKLCFYMSERWLKPPVGALRFLHPVFLIMALEFRSLSKSEYFHYLPTGPFAAKDIELFTSMKNRTWSWGYFTQAPVLTRKVICNHKNEKPLNVLWIGRMLGMKRVDLLIEAVSKVNASGKRLHLTLVGDGPERVHLEKLAATRLDEEDYTFTGFIQSSLVPNLMVDYDIYVLPSNAYEGWGAVVNEAMSVGCAVIASDDTGSGRSMITHGHNGLLFKSGSTVDLTWCLRKLIEDNEKRVSISQQAIRDFSDQWSPTVAARRFFQVVEGLLLNGHGMKFTKGPMKNIDFDKVW